MNEKLDQLNPIASWVAAISLIVVMLVTSINYNVFNRDFYNREYEQLEIASEVGMTQEDLEIVTENLLSFIKGDTNSIQTKITIEGTVKDAFNSKEEAHMVSVRLLYQGAQAISNVAFVAFILSVAFLIGRLRSGACTLISINYIKAAILFSIFVIFCAGWAYVDFDSFWFSFHKLVFRNDLWMLDPETDLMIRLFPAPFFSAMVFRIVALFLIGFLIVFGIAYAYLHYQLKHFEQEDLIHEE